MARARNIKPGLYQNDDLAECSVWARYIFPGLWMLADRDGKLEDRPAKLKAALLPYDSQKIDPLLTELHSRGFIVRYSAGGGKYIQILNFRKHQNPHVKEPASIIPDPPGTTHPAGLEPDESGARTGPEPDKHGSGPADSGFPHPSPDSGLRIGSEPVESGSEPAVPPTPDLWGESDIRFDPKAGAWHGITDGQRSVWSRAYPAVDIDAELARAAAWQVANPAKKKSNYTRFLTTWLKGEQDKGGTRQGRPPPGPTRETIIQTRRTFLDNGRPS